MTKTIVRVLGLLIACSLTMADANAQTTTSYPVTATCSGGGQLCNNVANIQISTTGILQANFAPGPLACSSVRIHYLVDGTEVTVTGFVGLGQSTGVVNLGPVSAGTHVLGLQAEGMTGGCNSGTLGSWAGTAQVTVDPQTTSVPTLSEWGVVLLALILGFGGLGALRRRNPRRI